MHRRARHLNARDAGATLVLDSRFITGLNDGDAVSIWNDRSRNGNNASGSGSTRPTFKVSVQGGNSVVRFDGNDYLVSSSNTGITGNSSRANFAVGVQRIASTSVRAYTISDYGIAANTARNGLVTYNSKWYLGQYGVGDWATNINEIIGQGFVVVFNKNGETENFNLNGGAVITRQNTMNTSANPFVIGAAAGDFAGPWDGDICSVFITPHFLDLSLRRRLEHSAAFAFKIPCS